MKISDNNLDEVINCLYRVTDEIFETFSHIEEFISEDLKKRLIKEREKFVDEQNKRVNNL